jgi:phosphate transport system substrate-binding protein
VRIGGDGGALAGLAPVLRQYAAIDADARFTVIPGIGSVSSVRAVVSGALDIAITAHDQTEAERAAGAVASPYARTALAFCTHPSNPTRALTSSQVARMFTGELPRWPDGTPVRVIRRPADVSDVHVMASYSDELGHAARALQQRRGLRITATDQETADAIQQLPGALGALTTVQLKVEQRQIAVLTLDGIVPDAASVAAGRYRMTTTFSLVTAAGAGREIAGFVEFVRAGKARALLEATGHVPA